MNTTEWFVGSASRSIDPDPTERANTTVFAGIQTPLLVHAVGFRGEDCLLAVVVCDIQHPELIDVTSVTFHINLHPITPVEVIIIASGTSASPDYAATSEAYQHRVVHAITDCVIDALTFGCPAIMRVTPRAIQWRKFDELPIATLAIHAVGTMLNGADRATFIRQCQAPVLHVTRSGAGAAQPVSQMLDALATAAKNPVTAVRWQHADGHWLVTVNEVQMAFVPPLSTMADTVHTIAINPTGVRQ